MKTPSLAAMSEPQSICNHVSNNLPREQSEPAESLYALIARQPFFAGLDPRHLKILADSAMRTHFYTGQGILEKGDWANRFYLILQGRVVLESTDEHGHVHRLQELGAGDALGWSWLFPPYYWHYDAYAQEPTDAVFFYGTRLREQCETNPEFGYELMKRVSEVVISRLQATRRQWAGENHAKSPIRITDTEG
jgi:CRP/FNR family transcriptional regulator, cyclic AMP receptor protein